MKKILICLPVMFSLLSAVYAQQGAAPAMPPANVVVDKVTSGMIAPEAEFIGTVFYKEVSDVAAEVTGRVDSIFFEEGQRVKRGDELVRLNADLLKKSLLSSQASYEDVLTQLEKARLDLKRAEKLYREQSVAEQFYDDARFAAKSLENKAHSLQADVESIKTELEKKSIKAPFSGLVVQKKTELGQWVAPGDPVATIARTDVVDVIADVPQSVLPFIQPGARVQALLPVQAGVRGKPLSGEIVTVIARGNVATRTFPVKVRAENNAELIEGMEVKVVLPTAEKQKTLAVNRDALITASGQTVLFTVENSVANVLPVKVVGYDGMIAGVEAPGLRQGMDVVIKGNERLRPGQPVHIVTSSE